MLLELKLTVEPSTSLCFDKDGRTVSCILFWSQNGKSFDTTVSFPKQKAHWGYCYWRIVLLSAWVWARLTCAAKELNDTFAFVFFSIRLVRTFCVFFSWRLSFWSIILDVRKRKATSSVHIIQGKKYFTLKELKQQTFVWLSFSLKSLPAKFLNTDIGWFGSTPETQCSTLLALQCVDFCFRALVCRLPAHRPPHSLLSLAGPLQAASTQWLMSSAGSKSHFGVRICRKEKIGFDFFCHKNFSWGTCKKEKTTKRDSYLVRRRRTTSGAQNSKENATVRLSEWKHFSKFVFRSQNSFGTTRVAKRWVLTRRQFLEHLARGFANSKQFQDSKLLPFSQVF